MNRGSVFWVDLRDATPPEFGKVRPAVVVSNSLQNEILPTVVVVPLSTVPGEIWPLRIAVPPVQSRDSLAVVPGIRQVHKARLRNPAGSLPEEALSRLDQAIAAYLAD